MTAIFSFPPANVQNTSHPPVPTNGYFYTDFAKRMKKLRKNLQIQKMLVPLQSRLRDMRSFGASREQWKFTYIAEAQPKNSKIPKEFAEIAQLVEHNLAKVGVASSSLVFRSKKVSRNADLNFETPDVVQLYAGRPLLRSAFLLCCFTHVYICLF